MSPAQTKNEAPGRDEEASKGGLTFLGEPWVPGRGPGLFLLWQEPPLGC